MYPGDIGTVKLNKYSLEKMGLVNFEGDFYCIITFMIRLHKMIVYTGKSMVSFLTAGEGMNVAIFTGSDFEGIFFQSHAINAQMNRSLECYWIH